MTMLAEPLSTRWLVRPRNAVSSGGKIASSAIQKALGSLERSFALFGPKRAAISQIWALVNECSEMGWDGEHAEPVSELAAERAADFIRALPDSFPLPEFAPEPDGSISLDWIRSRSRLFSLSVGAGSRLPYAWLDGTDIGHGVARFDGETVPSRILEGIRGIVDRGKPSFWPS